MFAVDIPGLKSVKVRFGGNIYTPRVQDGYLGKFDIGVAELSIATDPEVGLVGVTVDADKNVAKLNPSQPLNGSLFYARSVDILRTSKDRLPYTKKDNNNIRLLELTGEETENAPYSVIVYECSIIGQDGQVHFVADQTLDFQVWRTRGKNSCPGADKWPAMQAIILEMAQQLDHRKLPYQSRRRWKKPEPPTTLDSNVGWVRWWNWAQGWGTAATSQGDVVVHWTAAPSRPGQELRYLKKGELFRFTRLENRPQKPGQEMQLKRQAVGITLLQAM